MFPEPAKKGFKTFVSNNDFKAKKHDDALVVTIHSQGKSKEITLTGSKGKTGEPQVITIGKLDFTLAFGSKAYELPFKVQLNDFIATKYPGTEKSYAAFESQVTVLDGTKNRMLVFI